MPAIITLNIKDREGVNTIGTWQGIGNVTTVQDVIDYVNNNYSTSITLLKKDGGTQDETILDNSQYLSEYYRDGTYEVRDATPITDFTLLRVIHNGCCYEVGGGGYPTIKYADILVVGGGGAGGGGGSNRFRGAGGGGGEVVWYKTSALCSMSMCASIGCGGQGTTGGGGNGCSTTFGPFNANGGCGGPNGHNVCGGTSGNGHTGGQSSTCGAISPYGGAGGGGGDGGNGCNAGGSYTYYGGNGGQGTTTALGVFGGGGGGGGCTGGSGGSGGGGSGAACNSGYGGNGGNGTTGTGGGGGGAVETNCKGGNGGSGIVIVAYPLDGSYGFTCATGGDCCCTIDGCCVHYFTSDGTFCIVS